MQILIAMKSTNHNLPSHWALFTARHPIISQMYEALVQGRIILNSISAIQVYTQDSQDLNLSVFRNLMSNQNQLCVNEKKQKIKQSLQDLFQKFKKLHFQQIKVTTNFFKVMLFETASNKECYDIIIRIEQNNPNQYSKYLKDYFVKSLIQLKQFMVEQAQITNKHIQIIQFYSLYMKKEAENIIEQQIIQRQPQDISQKLKVTIQDIQQILNPLLPGYQQHFQISQYYLITILISLLLFPIAMLSYLFVYFQNYDHLSSTQYAWEGPAFCIIYLWINYCLSKFCFQKGINVPIALGFSFFQQIFFHKKLRNYGFIFAILTFAYILSFGFYLIWQGSVFGQVINGIFVLYFVLQISYGCKMLSFLGTISYKLSYLHFKTMLIPMIDIVATIANLSSQFSKQIKLLIDLIMIVCICALQIVKIKKHTQAIPYLFIAVLAVIISINVWAIFGEKQLITWIAKVLKEIIFLFLLSYKFAFFTPKQFIEFVWKQIRPLFPCFSHRQIINTDEQELQDLLHLASQINCAQSYPKAVKILFLIATIFYLFVLLPFGIEICYHFQIHKYVLETVLLIGYAIFSVLYINETNLRLKHPFANYTHLENSMALINCPNHGINFNIGNLRILQNPYDPAPFFSRSRIFSELQGVLPQIIERNQSIFNQIHKLFQENLCYKMLCDEEQGQI